MKKRCYLGCVSALCLCLYSVFLSTSPKVSADVYYTRVSWSDMASYIGATVQGYYLSDTDVWKPITLTRHSANTQYINSVDNSGDCSSLASSSYLVWYYASIPADIKQGSDTFLPMYQVDWNLHFSGVSYFGCMVGQTNNSVYKTVNVTDARVRNYVMAGQYNHEFVLTQSALSNTNVPNSFTVYGGGNGVGGYTGTWLYYEDTAADYYIGSAYYSNTWNVANQIFFCLSCPVINNGASFVDHALAPEYTTPPLYDGDGISSGVVSGVISDGTSTQAVNVTVETDNSGLIGSLLSGIKNLFVPSDEQLETFSTDMDDLLHDHLGGLYEAVDLIEDQYDGFGSVSAKTELYVPPATVHLLGNDSFTVGDWHIPLKVSDSRFDFVYTSLAFLIDFLATAAFVTMCRRKLELFLNPEAEVITDDS